MLVVSYTTVSPLPARSSMPEPSGGLFSVALSRGSPRVAVNNHPALWSPDFPRQPVARLTRSPGRLVRRPPILAPDQRWVGATRRFGIRFEPWAIESDT